MTLHRLQTELSHSARHFGGNSVSLLILFQVLTACSVFFAVLRISPAVALVATLVLAPAIIRTAWVAEIHRQRHVAFPWHQRLRCFAASIGIVLVVATCGILVFVLISMVFGLLGLLFGVAVSESDFYVDTAILGAIGGMVWGMAGGFLAICFATCKLWHPTVFWK